MGTTVLDSRYRINGLLSTDQTVLGNLEKLCKSSGCWLTYDIHAGKWSVIINRSGSSIYSFTDSNIVGSLTISGTGLTDLYNSVRAEFPHRDLRDQTDFVAIEIPDVDRNSNEPDNQLVLQYDVINDPVQAELLAFIELKQSRVDKVVRFQTDFTALGLKAGDIIDITNSIYGFTNKLFRIVTISEIDADDGGLNLEITALEYDADVYDESNLYRYLRTDENGIKTIGSIDKPAAPTLTKFESDSRPRLNIEAISPTGTVEAMEFWLSDDGLTYQLIDTKRPLTAGSFASGEEIVVDYDSLNSGNVYCKVRASNSITSSEYSDISSLVYAPIQVADAIGPNTQAIDSSGNPLTALALTALLNNLDGLFGGNTAAGGLFDTIFSLFNSTTGVDILSNSGRMMISDSAGQTTVPGLPQTSGTAVSSYTTPSFTASRSTLYKFDIIADQNTSAAVGGRGGIAGGSVYPGEHSDYISVSVYLNDITASTTTTIGASGGYGAFYWTDFAITNALSLTAGHTYTIEFKHRNETGLLPTGTVSFDFSWNVYTLT